MLYRERLYVERLGRVVGRGYLDREAGHTRLETNRMKGTQVRAVTKCGNEMLIFILTQ